MSVFTILYAILIGPIQLIFEVIYSIANRFIGHPGLSIIVLSLVMNFLVLPLYKRADNLQEESRKMEEKLQKGINHIKKSFSGDEKMMILQTYYRQNNYKPTDALNGSISLLLEIPFFMAAYNFLSNLPIIQGVRLGPISDLGTPDALVVIGGITINVLPILMTIINILSGTIYLKGSPAKAKIQTYGIAIVFLIFLYKSPAGLVFYWTLNNVFSLVKNIFYKLSNPKKVFEIMLSCIGGIILFYDIFLYKTPSLKMKLIYAGCSVLCQLPIIMEILQKHGMLHGGILKWKNNKKIFWAGTIFLTILTGILIPSTLIAASPQEFIDITYFHNPLWYIANCLSLAAGTFMVWMGVFYWISNSLGKAVFDKVVWIMCGIMMINYMFFGTELGIISANLQYENGLDFNRQQEFFNIVILMFLIVIMFVISYKWKYLITGVLFSAIIVLMGMGLYNIKSINASVMEAKVRVEELNENTPHFNLSKNGKNVIVLMLDRSLGEYIPYIFNEKTELKEKFEGFTYYANTISFAGYTNLATPALFGGYEYTPLEINKRDTELLVDKHNEALKVMPVLFYENGYEVTLCDLPYANYQWISDYSIYDDYPDMNTYYVEGTLGSNTGKEYEIENRRRNFFCFSIMKSLPLCLQEIVYDNGNYNQLKRENEEIIYTNQTLHSNTIAEGLSATTMKSYNALANLSSITLVMEETSNTFLMMTNNFTHEPMMLQEPAYEPSMYVDNTEFYADNMERFIIDGKRLKMENAYQIAHYQTNMAAMIQLGKWFDYMRENNVYDNTRIILVADHGNALWQMDELILENNGDVVKDIERYYPLLMIKDFDSKGFNISNEFMTNADVPTLATKDIIKEPKNPFTGKILDGEDKKGKEQYITTSIDWDIQVNNGNTFSTSTWYSVKDNIWDKNNWDFIDREVLVPIEME